MLQKFDSQHSNIATVYYGNPVDLGMFSRHPNSIVGVAICGIENACLKQPSPRSSTAL